MKFKQILESVKIPKKFTLPNGVRVDICAKKNMLDAIQDFLYNLKHGYDVSDMTFKVLNKDGSILELSDDSEDIDNYKRANVKSAFQVWADGYVISDIDDVVWKDTRKNQEVSWDAAINIADKTLSDNLELYFKN